MINRAAKRLVVRKSEKKQGWKNEKKCECRFLFFFKAIYRHLTLALKTISQCSNKHNADLSEKDL